MNPPNAVVSENLIDAVTTKNGAVVILAEVYIDESGTHDQSSFLVIAGYVYLRKKAKRFSRGMEELLKKYGLPYFHMVDCAHGAPPFDKLSKQQCIDVEKGVIKLTKRFTRNSYSLTPMRTLVASIVSAYALH